MSAHYLVGDVAYSARNASAVKHGKRVLVIDPEDREQVEQLVAALKYGGDRQHFAERLQDAVRVLVAPVPPKPAEPTARYAVVVDAEGSEWVRDGLDSDRAHSGPWWNATSARESSGNARRAEYAEIDAVRVLSEGVTA